MKSQPLNFLSSISLLTVFRLLISWTTATAQTNIEGTLTSKPPTGLYVSATPFPETFVVRLETNGNYQVRIESPPSSGRQKQEGTWKWSAAKQEFLLTPSTNSGSFVYEFRRLRVDKYVSDTLQWIPLHGQGASAGAIDYIRFKRSEH